MFRVTMLLTAPAMGLTGRGWVDRESYLGSHCRLEGLQGRCTVTCLVPTAWRTVNDVLVRAGMACGILRRGSGRGLWHELLRDVCLCELGMRGAHCHSWLKSLTL